MQQINIASGRVTTQSSAYIQSCGQLVIHHTMVAPAVEAAVQSALANQQYDRIAAILDAAELEVIQQPAAELLP